MIAKTPKPPYYAVIFTSTKTDNTEGYDKMADKMLELAKTQTGFLGFESAREERIKQRAARVVRKAMRDASVNKEGVMMNNEARRLSSSAANN